jgi:hypothetical protein
VGEKGVTKNEGIAQKCTLCYDRIGDGLEPACAKACPTTSIQFGDLDELRERAEEAGRGDARGRHHLAGSTARTRTDGVGGVGAFFLLMTSRRSTGCRPTRWSPRATCRRCGRRPGFAALTMLAGRSRRSPGRLVTTEAPAPEGGRRKGGGGRGERRHGAAGRVHLLLRPPIVKASPWEHDIPAYLFLGGWRRAPRSCRPAPT